MGCISPRLLICGQCSMIRGQITVKPSVYLLLVQCYFVLTARYCACPSGLTWTRRNRDIEICIHVESWFFAGSEIHVHCYMCNRKTIQARASMSVSDGYFNLKVDYENKSRDGA